MGCMKSRNRRTHLIEGDVFVPVQKRHERRSWTRPVPCRFCGMGVTVTIDAILENVRRRAKQDVRISNQKSRIGAEGAALQCRMTSI